MAVSSHFRGTALLARERRYTRKIRNPLINSPPGKYCLVAAIANVAGHIAGEREKPNRKAATEPHGCCARAASNRGHAKPTPRAVKNFPN
jgi:hypothetical protein